MQQTYSYYVGGSGRCSNSQEDKMSSLSDSNENHDGSEDDTQRLKLDANLMIYSNFEQTMSFLIRLNFESFKIQSKSKLSKFSNKTQKILNFFLLIIRKCERGRFRGSFSQ